MSLSMLRWILLLFILWLLGSALAGLTTRALLIEASRLEHAIPHAPHSPILAPPADRSSGLAVAGCDSQVGL